MTIALIRKSKNEIVQTYSSGPVFVNVPGILQAYNVDVGWVSGDYECVAVVPFDLPDGKVRASESTYTLDGNTVTEHFEIADAPTPEPIKIAPLDFIGLLTTEEALAITTAGQTDAQISLFMTMASAAKEIDMGDPRTLAGLEYLVSKNLITADRMAQIVAGGAK